MTVRGWNLPSIEKPLTVSSGPSTSSSMTATPPRDSSVARAIAGGSSSFRTSPIERYYRDVRGAKVQGTRTGNWLTKAQAEKLINSPDCTTLMGRRDRAMLAVMIGCGLRREEVAQLRLQDVQQRDGCWVFGSAPGSA